MKMYNYWMNVLMAVGILVACAPAQGSFKHLCIDYGSSVKRATLADSIVNVAGFLHDRFEAIDPSIKTFATRSVVGIASWYLVVRAMQYKAQNYKKDLPDYQLDDPLKASIEKRFSQCKPCSKLLIKQSPSLDEAQDATDQENIGARTYFFGNTACLELPVSFVNYSPLQQEALIAHEATHYSKNHIAKQMRLLAVCLGVGCAVVSLQPSYLEKLFAVGASYLTYGFVSSVQIRMHEKEADLADKTLEELYGMICALDKQAFFFFQIDNSLFKADHIEVHPSSFLDAYHTKKERIVYLMAQYEKQIANKLDRDIPKTADDCKKALRYYLTDSQIETFRNDTKALQTYCKDQHLLQSRLEQLFRHLGKLDGKNTVTKRLSS